MVDREFALRLVEARLERESPGQFRRGRRMGDGLGGSVPGTLTAIAAEALVPGLNPVLRVHTIQPCA